MSFDVFFQRFRDGEGDPGGGEQMRRVLAPHIVQEEAANSFVRVGYGDGGADIYLDSDNMMANHISGEQTWDLLVQGALAAQWVILPAGCPTCLTDESQRAHLPEGLDLDVIVVRSGEELLHAIHSA